MMQYDRQSLLREPLQFDCPPPSFEINDGKKPWITMAEAIILPNGFEKVKQASHWKQKEEEWSKIPFLSPYAYSHTP